MFVEKEIKIAIAFKEVSSFCREYGFAVGMLKGLLEIARKKL